MQNRQSCSMRGIPVTYTAISTPQNSRICPGRGSKSFTGGAPSPRPLLRVFCLRSEDARARVSYLPKELTEATTGWVNPPPPCPKGLCGDAPRESPHSGEGPHEEGRAPRDAPWNACPRPRLLSITVSSGMEKKFPSIGTVLGTASRRNPPIRRRPPEVGA